MSINGVEWILIFVVALILFGPKKLPELGKAVGKSLREFKQATSGLLNDNGSSKESEAKENKSVQEDVKQTVPNDKEPSKETESKVGKTTQEEMKQTGQAGNEPPKETEDKENKTVQEQAKQPNL